VRHETIQGKKRTYPGPSFSGCRLISVKNNVIDTIRYVTLPEIRQKLSVTSLNLHSSLNQAVVTFGT
jgi:hypothetical protein